MDVEVAESLVIEGARDFLKKNNPKIAMEVYLENSGGEISLEVVKKLRDFGYKSYFINQNGELEKVEGDLSKQIKTSNIYREVFENVIFLK